MVRGSSGKRWKTNVWSAKQRKTISLGTYDRPEEAALALAKHRGQSMEDEDSEGVEEEEGYSQDEEEEPAESADRPTEVRLLSRSALYSRKP